MPTRKRTSSERDSSAHDVHWTDEPSEDSRRSSWLAGCGMLGALLVLLGLGATLLIAVGHRFDSDDPEPSTRDSISTADASSPPQPAIAASLTPPTDPAVLMRARYRPSPYATLERLIPSGRLLPQTSPTQILNGRTIDNPWIVPGGTLRPTPLPPAASQNAPTIRPGTGTDWGAPLSLVPRTPADLSVRAYDSQQHPSIVRYLVQFEGYPGHFEVDATIQTELGRIQAGGSDGARIAFTIQAPITPDGRPLVQGESYDTAIQIAAVDDQGRASIPIRRQLQLIPVGAGDVEVTLSMSQATDLDLYVTSPTGQTIYYGNTRSSGGGHLDLDANAACRNNVGVNHEHVLWPTGRATAGTYRVHVSNYESCIQGNSVDYRITIQNCGETAILRGRFRGEGQQTPCINPQGADPKTCHRVVEFDVPTCTQP